MAYQSINPATGECEWQQDYLTEQALEARLQGKAGQTRDFKEGVLAFTEKRAPKWQTGDA